MAAGNSSNQLMGIEQLFDNNSYFAHESYTYTPIMQKSSYNNFQTHQYHNDPSNNNHHYQNQNLNSNNQFQIQNSLNDHHSTTTNSNLNYLSSNFSNDQPAPYNSSSSYPSNDQHKSDNSFHHHDNQSQPSSFSSSMFTQIDSYISQQSTPPQQTGNNINSSQPIPIKFDQNIHSPPHPIPIKFEQNSSSSQQVSFKFNHGQSPQHVPFKFEQSHSSSFNYKHSSLQGSSPPHSPQQMSINTSITSVPAHLNIPQQAIYPSPNSANSIKLSPIVPVASNYVSAHLPSSQTISTIPLHTNFSNNNDNSNLAEQKVVVCDYFGCGKTFTQLKNLKSHKRCHSEKSFECEQCGVKFKRLPDMYRHRRSVHDGGKPHRCEVCGKTFARADGLKNHQLTKGAAKKCANNKNNMKSLLSPY